LQWNGQFQGKSHDGTPEGKSPERQDLTLARDRSRAGDWMGCVMINSAACITCAAGARGKGGKPNRNSAELACSARPPLASSRRAQASDRAVLASSRLEAWRKLKCQPIALDSQQRCEEEKHVLLAFQRRMLAPDPLSQLIHQLLAAHLVVLQLLQPVQHIL
jgi:hypothetical protein